MQQPRTYTLTDLQDVHQDRMNAQTHADQLAEREAEIARNLLVQGHTQEELAPILGVSRQRVGQLVGNTRALRRQAREAVPA